MKKISANTRIAKGIYNIKDDFLSGKDWNDVIDYILGLEKRIEELEMKDHKEPFNANKEVE